MVELAITVGYPQTTALMPPNPSSLAQTVQRYVTSNSLAGAVMLVANASQVLDVTCVGFSDLQTRTPVHPSDLFWIASESKPITATALMILVDEGKIQLDDPVQNYLPEFADLWLKAEETPTSLELKRPSHPITIREILSHTSGLRFSSVMERPTLDVLPLRDAVRSYAMMPLETEPGTRYSYSNAGINTAGRIIEVISQLPYETFLEERLFHPLGMQDTTFRPNSSQISRLAKAYKPDPSNSHLLETSISQLKYPLDSPDRYPFPGGGVFSTADDLRRFCQMILNRGVYEGRRLLSEDAVSEMTRKQTGDHEDANYGLGWGVGDTFGHGGAYSTNLTIDPKNGLILLWMVQHEGYVNDGDQALAAFHQSATTLYARPAQ